MRAAIYARYSSHMQREESIDAQLRAARAYCEKKGYIIVKEYCDFEESAKTDKRPAFQEMIYDGRNKMFDRVIAYKVDRIARKRQDHIFYKVKLQEVGITIEYTDQPLDNSPESIILEGVLEAMSEYYIANLAREIKRGHSENALKAKFNGGTAPFGYMVIDGNYKINALEAIAVNKIFELYAEGKGYGAIASYLNINGYITRNNRPFSKSGLFEILRNRKYNGTYIFRKTVEAPNGKRNSHHMNPNAIVLANAIPPIVSDELWERVQKRLKENEKKPGAFKAKYDYRLSGKIYCGECGSPMHGSASNANGKLYLRYICSNRANKKTSCSNSSISLEMLESFAIHAIEDRIFDIVNLQEIINEINASFKEQSVSLQRELNAEYQRRADIQRKIDNLLNYIEDGVYDSAIGQRITRNKDLISKIDQNITELKCLLDKQVNDNSEEAFTKIEQFRSLLHSNHTESIRSVFDLFLNRVSVFKNYVDISLNLDPEQKLKGIDFNECCNIC